MKRALFILLWLAAAAGAQTERLKVGIIDFYGYQGLDLSAVRAALPVHEGDQVSEDQMENLIERIKQGARASDVNTVCCDSQGGLMIYIGLHGRSAKDVPYGPAPAGNARLPQAVGELGRQYSDALEPAIRKGSAGEDWSKGYALSADPALRAIQLRMREYAAGHQRVLQRVLESSSLAGQRALAAQLMGYARQSRTQIAVLVRASRDPDGDVRNNA